MCVTNPHQSRNQCYWHVCITALMLNHHKSCVKIVFMYSTQINYVKENKIKKNIHLEMAVEGSFLFKVLSTVRADIHHNSIMSSDVML